MDSRMGAMSDSLRRSRSARKPSRSSRRERGRHDRDPCSKRRAPERVTLSVAKHPPKDQSRWRLNTPSSSCQTIASKKLVYPDHGRAPALRRRDQRRDTGEQLYSRYTARGCAPAGVSTSTAVSAPACRVSRASTRLGTRMRSTARGEHTTAMVALRLPARAELGNRNSCCTTGSRARTSTSGLMLFQGKTENFFL